MRLPPLHRVAAFCFAATEAAVERSLAKRTVFVRAPADDFGASTGHHAEAAVERSFGKTNGLRKGAPSDRAPGHNFAAVYIAGCLPYRLRLISGTDTDH